MSQHSFRPQLEELGSRLLPSASPAISISDVWVTEGNSGQTAAVFTVSLSKPSSHTVTVNFATADHSATAGLDYQAAANGGYSSPVGSDYQAASGTLTFAPGETTKTITVLVNGDTNPERFESFAVNLSGARHASIAVASGFGYIEDDDAPPPGLYVDPYSGWLIPFQGPPPPDDGGVLA